MPPVTIEALYPGFDRAVANGSEAEQAAVPGRLLSNGAPSYTVLESLLGDPGRRTLLFSFEMG